MPQARLNGVSVHYQQAGHGPDLVLIHGLFCNLAFWYLSVVPVLAERFRVTIYDLRGHGYTDATRHGYRAVDLAKDLSALLDHLNIQQTHLVGHSYGGAVALAFAIGRPERVLSLTLADAWVPTLQRPFLPKDRPAWLQLQNRLKTMGLEMGDDMPRVAYGFFEELSASMGPNVDPRNGAGWLAGGSVGGRRNSLALRRWRELMRSSEAAHEISDGNGIMPEHMRRMMRPTAILFGRRSRFLPTMEGLQRILPNSRSILVPGAGHFFPILKPDAFVGAVSHFTESTSGIPKDGRRTL